MSAFEELGLMEPLCAALEEMEWYLPTPVQQDAVTQILGGSDVCCAAETGAGKTGAFCLPIIQLIYEKHNRNVDEAKIKATLKHCTLNKEDSDNGMRVAENGVTCSAKNIKSWGGARALYGVTKGKWGYNLTVAAGGLGIKAGWATMEAKLDLGSDGKGFAFCGNGNKSYGGNEARFGEPLKKGDVLTCLIDRDARNVSFLRNGESMGEAFKIQENMDKKPFFPCVSAQNGSFECSFGLRATEPPAPGYQWIEEAKGEEQVKNHAEFVRRKTKELKGERHIPTCIILEPTLELCKQIVDELLKFVKFIDSPKITVSSIFGKRQTREILDELEAGVDIIVGTPSRLRQFIEMGPEVLSLAGCDHLVFDEADRLLDSENINLAKKLYTDVREASLKRLQICMFSATLHEPSIQALAGQLCPNAVWVDLKGKDYVPETVHHAVVYADPDDDNRWNGSIIETDGVHEAGRDEHDTGPDPALRMSCVSSFRVKKLKPEILLNVIDAYEMEQCLIFCRTRDDCDHLSAFLNAKGGKAGYTGRIEKGKENKYSNVGLHSGFDPRTRADNLEQFKEGEARFLICTDVAARGIDIKQLPFVINMTLPDKPEDYIHRIGRTGRADRMGMAVSIVTSKHREKVWYHSNCNRGMRRGSPCQDTRLVTEGGCCIWYNEPQYIKEIEKRCGEQLEELGADYKMASAAANKEAVEYGRSRSEAKMKKSDHIAFIEEHSSLISNLSTQTQDDFLTFKAQLMHLATSEPTDVVMSTPGRGAGRGRRIVPATVGAGNDDFPTLGSSGPSDSGPVKTLARSRKR
eukprot:TRINITY_DN9079_c0_g1_i1.p1 TRINITY_DN9079_c0_g1~~TRINITY_DN9079_c0_g1_i1.p1  ORF type:complete len:805 (+),score=321.89 TRINITY_DN9079_c0_g1_i1:220-2634(+)